MGVCAWINILSLPIVMWSSVPIDDCSDTEGEIHWDVVDSWLDAVNAPTGPIEELSSAPTLISIPASSAIGLAAAPDTHNNTVPISHDAVPAQSASLEPLDLADSGSFYPDGLPRSSRRLKTSSGNAIALTATAPSGSSPQEHVVRPYSTRSRLPTVTTAAPTYTPVQRRMHKLEPGRVSRKDLVNPMGLDSRIAALRLLAFDCDMLRNEYFAALAGFGIAEVHLHRFRDEEFRMTRQRPWIHRELLASANITDIQVLMDRIVKKARDLGEPRPRNVHRSIIVWKRYVIDPLLANPGGELPYEVEGVIVVILHMTPVQRKKFFIDQIDELESQMRGHPPAASPRISSNAGASYERSV